MTTNPTRVVELKINGSWVDVSGWVDVGDGGAAIVITRGRENEQADTQPGTCTFSLVNDDGRFSLDLPAGAYYPHFKRWIEVRVTIKGSRRFTGYVSNVATTLDDDTGLHAHSEITCTDALGIQAQSPIARSWANDLMSALSPTYWWPMNDAEGSLIAAASAGGIDMAAGGTPGNVVFGTEGVGSLEADSQVTLNCSDSGTVYGYLAASLPAIATPFTVLFTITADNVPPTNAQLFNFVARNVRLLWNGPTLTLGEQSTSVAVPSAGIIQANQPTLIAVTVTSTSVALLAADGTVAATLTRPTPGATLSGPLWLAGGALGAGVNTTYSNAAILPYLLSPADYTTLRARLLGDGTSALSDWLNRALAVAGVTVPLSLTADRQMQRPTLKGSNPAEIGNTLAKSCGGVYLAARDGTPTWLDPTYCPAWVEIPFEHIDTDVSREPDESLSYTDVTVDGVVVAATGGWPKGERELPGLLPDSSLTKYATWLANTADVWAQGRFSQLPIDLLPLDSATTDAYLALDVRSRILPTGVPPQFPADMVYTVEGSSETVTKDTWQITLNTAPDPRFVLGDTVAGVLGSNYRLFWT